MKKIITVIVLIMGYISISVFANSQLLKQEDIEFQKLDNARGVALGSLLESEHPWGSYNHWQCFNVTNLYYNCVEYDDGILVPSLRVETQHEIFNFDLHVEDKANCDQTLIKWRALIDGGDEFCVLAAHMPDVDMGLDGNLPETLWYINRVKGINGYWNLFEEALEYQ